MTEQSLHNLTEEELIDLLTELDRIKVSAEEVLLAKLQSDQSAVRVSSPH